MIQTYKQLARAIRRGKTVEKIEFGAAFIKPKNNIRLMKRMEYRAK